MSAAERARFAIQSLLARGLGATSVARASGLARASEGWGGSEPRDRPAWYVWLSDSPGAYKLELEDAEDLPSGAWRARITIRYYPSADESAFGGFSGEERAVVEDGLIDATGTPRIEVASRIPRPLFVVGSLEWTATPEGDATAMVLLAMDRLVARDGAGRTLRDVPSWKLSSALMTTLAGLHAKVDRRTALRVRLTRQVGLEFVLADGGPRWEDTAARVQAEAGLLFAAPGGSPDGVDALLDAMMDPGAEVVADERFDGRCRHPARLEADDRIPLPVSHAWFGGETIAEDRIACAC